MELHWVWEIPAKIDKPKMDKDKSAESHPKSDHFLYTLQIN